MLPATTTDLMAAIILTVFAAVPVLQFAVHYRGMNYTLAQIPVYLIHIFYSRIIWRTTTSGRFQIADHQGAVIICNHTSSIDPSFVQLAADRCAHWMVAREYFKMPLLSWVFGVCGAIPVRRGGADIEATRLAIKYLKQGDLVGMFPEGRINTTDEILLPGRPGVVLIALKARVPVIPCYVSGTPYNANEFGCLLMFAHVHVEVGRPMDISEFYGRENEKSVLEELTKRCLCEIAKLGGQKDYVPRLAGRNWHPRMANFSSPSKNARQEAAPADA